MSAVGETQVPWGFGFQRRLQGGKDVSWALKGKSVMLWHGEPQDVSATDRMTVDKERKQGFIFGGGRWTVR